MRIARESVGYDSKRVIHDPVSDPPRLVPPLPSMMPRPDDHAVDAPSAAVAPSKTRRKQAMHALQDLGEALVALDAKRLRELDLPERLVDAVIQARGIRAHEGRRRQIQYIGKLMRDVDPEPVQAALERWTSGEQQDNAKFAALERWREQVLADDAALDRFVLAYPQTDHAHLASLIRDARAERARGGPPHRYRELFRQLKAAIDLTA